MTSTKARAGLIGQPIPRKEDLRLVQGHGQFTDDLDMPGALHAVMLRSPHPHARIRHIDPSRAQTCPGVRAVLTGADALADGLRPIPHHPVLHGPPDISLENRDGSPIRTAPHDPLPVDVARYCGEVVAVVIAETLLQAEDAVAEVRVEWDVLPCVTSALEAGAPDAPLVHAKLQTNVCVDAEVGDGTAVARAFAGAAHVARLVTHIPRVTATPMEARGALAWFDAESGQLTLWGGSGGVVRQKRELAHILGMDESAVRVLARDIGGNFGSKNSFYPESALVAWASRKLGRAVRWTNRRSEGFLSDYQGRDLHAEAALAIDADGRFLALQAQVTSNVGAHTVSFVPLTKGAELLTGVYAIPAAHVRARAVLTHTPPTCPYRSAGRPEAIYIIERLVDEAARLTGLDRIAIRVLNMIDRRDMPYTNALGLTYDSGDYRTGLQETLELADVDGFPARAAASAKAGRLRGLGIAPYVEVSGGFPREQAEIIVPSSGPVQIIIGTLASGQGHETTFAQVTAEWLGIPIERIQLLTGDTERVSIGGGSHAGRSMRAAGIVLHKAAQDLLKRARLIAADHLDAPPDTLRFADGRFAVPDTNRMLDLSEIAAFAEVQGIGLQGIGRDDRLAPGFPFGCHVCEVEVDPLTGCVAILRYSALDDVGRAVNPLILHGQTHGGIVQGLGQALSEVCLFEAGQAISGSLLDYALPRAADVPFFSVLIGETLAENNALGVRSGGEGGTTPALAVVANAVLHALGPRGVHHLDMPLTSARIWHALHQPPVTQRLGA